MGNRQSGTIEERAVIQRKKPTIPDPLFPIPTAAQRPTKKRHEGAWRCSASGNT